MKTLKLKKQLSLKKEKIAALNKEQLKHVQGGVNYTWIGCPETLPTGEASQMICTLSGRVC